MVQRVFLGSGKLLPNAIAENIAALKAQTVPDISRIILVLPGKVARRNVQRALLEFFPQGVLPPQLLTPHLLLHYCEEKSLAEKLPPPIVQQFIWGKVVNIAAQNSARYPALFPDGRVMAEKFSAGEQLYALRREIAAGGFSIADAAPFLGDRGKGLAELEAIFCRELEKFGYADPLSLDLAAAENCAPFAEIEKLIIAGVPDIPLLLKKKLENIAKLYPQLISIWINADESSADDYDQWGVPIAERWESKSFDLPLTSLHTALDPADAARRALLLAGKDGVFDPGKCAVVLADQSLHSVFAEEFSFMHSTDGSPIKVIDPGGMPFTVSRIYRLGMKLLKFLQNGGDFLDAAELLTNEDFLLYCSKNDESAATALLNELDDFKLSRLPDDFDQALLLCSHRRLRYALRRIGIWKKRFETMPPAAFLKKFFTAVFYHTDGEETSSSGVTFAAECDVFAALLNEFAAIPEKLTDNIPPLTVLEIFFRQCSSARLPQSTDGSELVFEGRLEMPFLTAERVVFCGMNEGFFPDRIDLTPFLTDSIRSKIGIRSNRDTMVRSLCHLLAVRDMRKTGALDIIVLRNGADGSAMRPSGLLFSGNGLSDDELLARCGKLFQDPPPLIKPPQQYGNKEFKLDFTLSYLQLPDGRLKLNVTDLDEYLSGAFGYFWKKVKKMQETDYSCCEPDAMLSGTLCHGAFERLPSSRHFPSKDALKAELFRNFDDVLRENFGDVLPMMVKLFAAAMKQRLEYAARILWEEQQAGFELLAAEYKLGGKQGYIEYGNAVFAGKIDRIEYHSGKKILRIIDIKTGSVQNVAKEHCSVSDNGLSVKFKKLQLPAYAILLAVDRAFKEQFPTVEINTVECAYLALPTEVTNSQLQVWDAEKLAAILPAAQAEIGRIVSEILASVNNVVCDIPGRYDSISLLSPDAVSALPMIKWQGKADSTSKDTDKPNKPAAAENIGKPFPALPPPEGAGNTRCCDCPPEIRNNCLCYGGDRTSCKSFNGFKSFSLISASAGTGKTYALASRFVQLLEYGVKPENIMAVTFTKKAAGEIFDRIIKRICSLDNEKCAACCRWKTPRRAVDLLRELMNNGGKELQISTIDSFFMRLLQAFAPELGIWNRIVMVNEYDDRFIRQVLRRWIRNLPSGAESDALRELLKEYNSSKNEGIYAKLLALVKNFHAYFQQYVVKGAHGSFPQLDGKRFYYGKDLLTREDCFATAEILKEYAAVAPNKTLAKRVDETAEQLISAADGMIYGKLSENVTNLLENLNEANGFWLDDDCETLIYKGNKAVEIGKPWSDALRKAFLHIREAAFRQVGRKNIAVFALIAEYDRLYRELAVQSGNITFSDLPALLTSLDPDSGERVLGLHDHSLEMRLDSTFKHYMFDEFQDTSDVQAMVLDSLLREHFAQADNGEFRTFFCVGDVKQSIYRWRNGNPELFNYISSCLRPIGELKGYDPYSFLVKSYRSAQAVLDAVNGVFCGYDGRNQNFINALRLMKYAPHISFDEEMSGYAALINVPQDGGRQQNVPYKAQIISDLLKEIEPLKRGFSVGILVNKNSSARAFAAELRRLDPTLPLSVDGVISPVDCMAFNVFKGLLILAFHPDDTLARNFLDMLIFGGEVMTDEKIAVRLGLASDVSLWSGVRRCISNDGLGGFARRFLDGFGKDCTMDEVRRLEILYHTAETFTGSCDEFLRQIGNSGERGNSVRETVQIMTSHQAKGLEFDIVFLPDTAPSGGNHGDVKPAREQLFYDSSRYYPSLSVSSWISYLPHKSLTDTSRQLGAHRKDEQSGSDFESLCKLYVGMTRAKHALFILTSRKNHTDNFAADQVLLEQLPLFGTVADDPEGKMEQLLTDRFGSNAREQLLFSRGKWEWFIREKSEKSSAVSETVITSWPEIVRNASNIRRASDEKDVHFSLSPHLRFASESGKNTGTEVHNLFEKINFIDDTFDAQHFADSCRVSAEAAKIFCGALADGSPIREALKIPSGNCEVWCEKRFLLRNKAGEIIPGAFDRVVICRRNGAVYKAEIIDYKSDRLDKAEKFSIYFPQLRLYRESLAQLLGLPQEKIVCKIFALRIREVIVVD